MPHVLAVALASVSLWCAYKWFRRETSRVESELRRTEQRLARRRRKAVADQAINLRLDPSTGIYLPAAE